MSGPLSGSSPTEDGVVGITDSGDKSGMFGSNTSTVGATSPGGNGVFGLTMAPGGAGVFGANNAAAGNLGRGVQGNGPEAGVGGFSQEGVGVLAQSEVGDGVRASTNSSERNAVLGMNLSHGDASEPGGNGVLGVTDAYGGAGVFGANNAPVSGRAARGSGGIGPGAGISGFSEYGIGVLARSHQGAGVDASTDSSWRNGVFGNNTDVERARSNGGNGVFGLTVSVGGAGVFGANNAPAGSPGRGVQGNGPEAGVGGFSEHGIGVLAQSGGIGIKAQAPIAGHFDGDIEVTGNIKLVGADCAEDFEVGDLATAEQGSVMVLDDHGGVRPSDREYDTRVAGVLSGAGSYAPALILDRHEPRGDRLPLALMGKVYCKVDATNVAVEIGDLLTTSSTPGHAMKAQDQQRAFGAVIGKALQPCRGTRGLIPILVALH